jgi:VanZ family protein
VKLPLSPCNTVGARLLLAITLLIVTWLMLSPSVGEGGIPINDKVAHALVFGLLALLAHASWPMRDFDRRFWIALLAYGLAIEILQHFIPHRSFSLLDLAADGLGIALYAWLHPVILPRLRIAA